MLTESLNRLFIVVGESFGLDGFLVKSSVVIVLVCLICGSVGSLVIGNRMAFFSDALAHCAWAGITLGILVTLLFGISERDPIHEWLGPTVMILFGALVGIGIAFVRDRTTLASDTVIGVFFAGAIGFGAILYGAFRKLGGKTDPEQFLFGSPHFVEISDLLRLVALAVIAAIILGRFYNQFIFASFNASLARSRRIPLVLQNYIFIVLLAMIVNICLRAVGVLLINAVLIVPAATAANLSRNIRQMFWWTIGVSVVGGIGGLWLSMFLTLPLPGNNRLELGTNGCIVVLFVLSFFLSIILAGVRHKA